MKKLLMSLLFAVIIVLIFLGVGYITFRTIGTPIPSIEFAGGELVEKIGIGYTVTKYYPLYDMNDTNAINVRAKFKFNIINFISSVILITIIVFFLDKLFNRKLKK